MAAASFRVPGEAKYQSIGAGSVGGAAGAVSVGAAADTVSVVSGVVSLGKNLNILVPQTGQVPWAALRPFLVVTTCASWTTRSVLHFIQ